MVRLSANTIRVVDDASNGGVEPPDSVQDPNSVEGAGPDHVGEWLREAREATGRDLRDVAAHLRIRYPYLLAIEEGRFDDLPGHAYAVGFIRSYSGHLGLDANAMVERFKGAADAEAVDQNLKFPTPVPEGRFPGTPVLLVSAFLVAALVGGWYYYQSRDSVELVRVPPPPQENIAPTGSTVGPSASLNPGETPANAGSSPVVPQPVVPEPALPESAVSETVIQEMVIQETVIQETPPGMPDREPVTNETVAAVADKPAAIGADTIMETPNADAPSTDAASTEVASSGAASSEVLSTDAATPMIAQPIAPLTPAPEVQAAPPEVAIVPPAEAPAMAETPIEEPLRVEQVNPPEAQAPEVEPEIATAAAAASAPVSVPDSSVAEATPAPDSAVSALPSIPAVTPTTDDEGRVYGLSNRDSRIVLTAKGDSWVQVRDADQNALLTRMLHAGDSYRVPNRPGLVMSVGNPSVLSVSVDEAPDFPLAAENVPISDITLDPERLRDGTAVR